MDERIKLTKEGLEKLKLKLELLKKEFQANEKAMTESCHNSSGDGPHDNAEFEELLRNERMLVGEINSLQERIKNVEIVKIQNLDDNTVNIDDFIDINLVFDDDDQEKMIVQLVGEEASALDDKVSINSPLGKAIYGHKIGETVSYSVNNNEIHVDLLRKVKKIGKKNEI